MEMYMNLTCIAISHDHRKLYTQEGLTVESEEPIEINELLEKLPECEPGEIVAINEAGQIIAKLKEGGCGGE